MTERTRWAPGKSAQLTDFNFELQGLTTIQGVAIVGWDQDRNEVRYTEYTTETGTWSGTWKKEGDSWIQAYQGLNLDGDKCTGKGIVEFSDKDP